MKFVTLRNLVLGILVLSLSILFTVYAQSDSINQKLFQKFKVGDIVFQSSKSGQSWAVQLATGSEYSHCGVIWVDKGKYYVLEAVQPVKLTPLELWIKHGDGNKFVVKRLKNSEKILTEEVFRKMKIVANEYIGRNYDLHFEWTDEKIYCSELVYKLFLRSANICIGKLQKIQDFDLSNEVVRKIIKERYGDKLPLQETVISPVAIFNSELLEEVFRN